MPGDTFDFVCKKCGVSTIIKPKYFVCIPNDKFPETIELIKWAKIMDISVLSEPPNSAFEDPYFIYGTRSFVLPHVRDPNNCMNNTEHLYDYSYLVTTVPHDMRFNGYVNFTTMGMLSDYWDCMVMDEDLFIRPNSGNKEFNGRVYNYRERTNGDLLGVERWVLCACAKPKKPPLKEYRAFCHNQFVLYSQYLPEDTIGIPKEGDEFVWKVIKEIEKSDPNAHSYVLDVGFDGEKYSVIELNSWNSSALYGVEPQSFLGVIFK